MRSSKTIVRSLIILLSILIAAMINTKMVSPGEEAPLAPAKTADSYRKQYNLPTLVNMSVADEGLEGVAQAVKPGKSNVLSLPRGEPGGIIAGRGKDVEGAIRFARIHHDLADWWADQHSLIALTQWLNKRTRIRADMNIKGGSTIRLTDPRLSRIPIVFFTGHDPSFSRSRDLARGAPLRGSFSKQEKDGLRKYIIENGGFIYFDACGVSAAAQEFPRLFLAQIRCALPEYSVNRIPNDHEIYNNFYEMYGPPVGCDIFWWGTHPPKRNFLEGVTIGDRLGILVSRRDYMCAMETVSIPGKTAHYSPGVYRFSTNVVIYSLTHGRISDYSHYVPENRSDNRIPTRTPVAVPELK